MASWRLLTALAPGVVTAAGMCAAVLPQSVFMENIKEVTQSYRSGFPVLVSPHVHNLFLEVKADLLANAALLEDYDITAEHLNSIKPYTVFGFDVYRVGWLAFGDGARVGVPEYFGHKDGDLQTYGIMVNNASVQWHTPAGEQLKASLVVSDDAKRFAIAREMLHLFRPETEKSALINFMNISLPWMVARGLQLRYSLSTRPKLVRGVVYSMVLVFAATGWLGMNDMHARSNQHAVDASLASLGEPRYVRGGAQYYDSLIRRNIALRSLLGTDGPSVYTPCGNEQLMLRSPCVPIVERAEFFRKALQAEVPSAPSAESTKPTCVIPSEKS